MRSITSPKTWLSCTNKPATLGAVFVLAMLICGAVFYAKAARAQAQQKTQAQRQPPARTLNCRDVLVTQAIFEQRKSGGSDQYQESLLKFYRDFPANCWLRAHVENELADYFQDRLNYETAKEWDQRLAFTLSQCQTGQCGAPDAEVDGFTCLKRFPEISSGAAKSDSCGFGREWDYIEKLRNQSLEEIKRSLAERAGERENILAGDFLRPFDEQKLAKLSDRIEGLRRDIYSRYKPTKLDAAYKLAFVTYQREEWANAAYLARYCLTETNLNGASPNGLNARQRVALLYLLYRALWQRGDYIGAMESLDYCYEGLTAFRNTIRDEQEKIEYFQNLETVLSDKVYLLLDRKEILNALIWLDESKAPILDEIISGKTKARASLARTRQGSNERRESQASFPGAGRGQRNPRPAQEEAVTKAEKPARAEDTAQVEDHNSEPWFGEYTVLEDKFAGKPDREKLKAGEIVVSYFLHRGVERSRLFTFVYVADRMPFALKREVREGAIEKLVNDFSYWVEAYNEQPPDLKRMEKAEEEAQAILEEMYDGLMRPVVDALNQRSINISGQKLIIIPFGATANFPFHAMFDATPDPKTKSNQYLFERFKGIAYAPSLKIYNRLRQNRIAGCDGMLGLALNQFEDAAPLGYTIQEIEEVKNHFQRSLLLRNREATKERLLKEYSDYPALHFATHAEFNRDHPQESKIRLYGDRDERNNLSAADLIDLNFRLAGKLIVLSACETGVQQPQPGDDSLGIERYLLAANASAIISSLWQVEDQATMEFMIEFYQEFTTGCIDPSFAWRTAMVRTKRKRPKNLFAWAPFKVTGY